MFVSQALVLDTVNQNLSLADIDGLTGKLDELLRIALEVIKTPTRAEDSLDAAPRELCSVLKLREDVGQLDVGLVQYDGCRADRLGGFPRRTDQ